MPRLFDNEGTREAIELLRTAIEQMQTVVDQARELASSREDRIRLAAAVFHAEQLRKAMDVKSEVPRLVACFGGRLALQIEQRCGFDDEIARRYVDGAVRHALRLGYEPEDLTEAADAR